MTVENKKIYWNVVKEECEYFNIPFDEECDEIELVSKINELNFANEARISIFLFQDLIPVGKEGRINAPATLSNDNWSYRFSKNVFNENKSRIAKFLKENAIKYGRD